MHAPPTKIYELIIKTSKSIDVMMRREKTRNNPQCVRDIQHDLRDKVVCAEVIPVMEKYIDLAFPNGYH